jgi:hypothetical protein
VDPENPLFLENLEGLGHRSPPAVLENLPRLVTQLILVVLVALVDQERLLQ